MFGFGGKQLGNGPIGIAVNASEVRLAQRAGNGYVLEHEPLAEGTEKSGPAYHAECSRAIGVALRRGKFSGKRAVSALSVEALRYKTLRMPPMPEEDMIQAIAWEAAERFQLTDEQSLQHYSAGQVHQGNELREEVILLAAEKDAVYDHAMAIKRAGLIPTAIDATGAALARVLGTMGQSTLVVHIDKRIAEIVGVRDDRVIFDKPVEMVRKEDKIDAAALSRELGLCLRYLSVTFGVHKPDSAWICGDGFTHELAAAIGDTLNIELRPAQESPAFAAIASQCDDPAAWAVPLGLAQHTSKGSAKRGAA